MTKKILIADNESSVLDTLVDSLRSQGYETCCARDGFEAMRVMAEESPDLMITDAQIPGLDGCLLTRYVRRASDIPVVMTTGVPQELEVLRNTDVGADVFMMKPIDLPQLVDNVARLLSGRIPGQAYDPSLQKSKADLDDGSFVEPTAGPMRIDTGVWEFDELINEGIPSASVTLVEGSGGSGKSVMCQNLAYSGYRWGLNIAYYTSLPTAEDLDERMSSLGLSVESGGLDQFKITSLANLYARQLDPSKTFTVLWEHMKRMFREGADMVVFDDLPPAVSEDYGPMINFFERSIELSRQGLTILSIFRSSHSDRVLVEQLHEIADAHLSFSVEETPRDGRTEVFNQMEVRKIDGNIPIPSRGVAFRVNPRLIKLENRSLEPLTGMGVAL
jgi:archaellum biogenesis ATPase FlaH/DNA-binding NarL/FixJ family response regulator